MTPRTTPSNHELFPPSVQPPPPQKKEFVAGHTSQNPQTEFGEHRGYLCTVGENVVTVFPFCLVILTEGF